MKNIYLQTFSARKAAYSVNLYLFFNARLSIAPTKECLQRNEMRWFMVFLKSYKDNKFQNSYDHLKHVDLVSRKLL